MTGIDVGPQAARCALVIGNASYAGWDPLKNPANDARAMATTLRDLGFKVTAGIDLGSRELLETVGGFCRQLAEAAERGEIVSAVLFYAGHGIQVDGTNYLLPIDADIRNKLELRTQAVELDVVMEALGASARTSVIMLDCCRNNPLPRTLGKAAYRGIGGEHGLANVRAPKGVYIAYSTQPNFVALDGDGDNSPFTTALLRHIDDPGFQVSDVMMRVRLDVYEATRGEQIPWDHSALFEPFLFRAVDASRLPADTPPEVVERLRREQDMAREASYWESVKRTSNVRFLQSFLLQFPDSPNREAAIARIETLRFRSYVGRTLAWGTAVVLGLVTVYTGVTWARFTTLAKASIVGGDIEADDWRERSSYLWCKARCVGLPQCIAFTYDPARQRCALKSEAAFYETPRAREGEEPAFSEIAAGYTPPRQTRYRLYWARVLKGTAFPRERLEQDPALKSRFRADRGNGGTVLRLTSLECQQACERLGEACKGFSHTRFGGGCEMFSAVEGFYTDPRNPARPLFLPATLSGCNDPTVKGCEPG